MIKQTEGKTERIGDASLQMSELALLTIIIQEEICKETGISLEAFESNLTDNITTYRLSRAGMSIKDALDITGLTDKCRSVTEVAKDGTRKEII